MRAQEVVWSLWISLNRLYSPRQLTAYKYEFFVKYYDGCFSMKRSFYPDLHSISIVPRLFRRCLSYAIEVVLKFLRKM